MHADEGCKAAEDGLRRLLTTYPLWLNAGSTNDTRRFREIQTAAKKLRSKRRGPRWLIDVHSCMRNLEQLRDEVTGKLAASRRTG
jgi:hypothetical protein